MTTPPPPNTDPTPAEAPKTSGLAIAGLVLGCLPLLVLPAMAIPAFQKVRATSQEKAITNNLRMFASAGQQYMLDHSVPVVDYGDLVGPAKHISRLDPVAGESYEALRVSLETTVLTVETDDGREISHTF